MSASPYATPGAIGPGLKAEDKPDQKCQSERKDIWNVDEVSGSQQYEYDDPRPQPDYEMMFKQSVGTEDVFLGMGPKNPSTASCESMVVRWVACYNYPYRASVAKVKFF